MTTQYDLRFFTMSNKTEFSDQVDFRTPEYLFEFIKSLYGRIDYDGACFEDGSNALAPPLRLENEWPNGIIYSNPPFDTDSIVKWIDKGFNHVQNNKNNIHIMLIPNKLCFVKLQKLSFDKISKIICLGGRVNFISSFSIKGGSSRNGSIILIQENNSNENITIEFKLLSQIKEEFK